MEAEILWCQEWQHAANEANAGGDRRRFVRRMGWNYVLRRRLCNLLEAETGGERGVCASTACCSAREVHTAPCRSQHYLEYREEFVLPEVHRLPRVHDRQRRSEHTGTEEEQNTRHPTPQDSVGTTHLYRCHSVAVEGSLGEYCTVVGAAPQVCGAAADGQVIRQPV